MSRCNYERRPTLEGSYEGSMHAIRCREIFGARGDSLVSTNWSFRSFSVFLWVFRFPLAWWVFSFLLGSSFLLCSTLFLEKCFLLFSHFFLSFLFHSLVNVCVSLSLPFPFSFHQGPLSSPPLPSWTFLTLCLFPFLSLPSSPYETLTFSSPAGIFHPVIITSLFSVSSSLPLLSYPFIPSVSYFSFRFILRLSVTLPLCLSLSLSLSLSLFSLPLLLLSFFSFPSHHIPPPITAVLPPPSPYLGRSGLSLPFLIIIIFPLLPLLLR